MHQPIILTTCDTNEERYLIRKAYCTAIEAAGGEILLLPPFQEKTIDTILAHADGLLLTGGDDIHPKHYGEEIAPHYNGEINEERDHYEKVLIEHAVARRVPILGICRGMQALNVFFGGSLYQDITHEIPNSLPHKTECALGRGHIAHEVTVVPESLLARIVRRDTLPVNSLHHQVVKNVGQGLSVNARATDGLIEGIEHTTYPFLLGVEWHPEELRDEPSRDLFAAFTEAARAYRDE